MRNRQAPSQPGIYRHAFPHYLDRADLSRLDVNDEQYGRRLLTLFLQGGEGEAPFEAAEHLAKNIMHLYFEARNIERNVGPRLLALGYPLLHRREGERVGSYPLFIWPLQLEPSINRIHHWTLRPDRDRRPLVNLECLQLLEEEPAEVSAELIGRLRRPAARNLKEWQTLFRELQAAFAEEEAEAEVPVLDPFPVLAELDQLPPGWHLHWSGVIGLYPPQLPIREPEPDELRKLFVEEGEPIVAPPPFGWLPLNPMQQSAFQSALSRRTTLVTGKPRSGKSHFLIQFLSNALSNGKKSLVVSDRVGKLQKVQDALFDHGLGTYSYLLKDGIADKSLLVDLLRTLPDRPAPTLPFEEGQYRLLLGKCLRQQQNLEQGYGQVRRKVHGEANWTDLVGHFLHNNRIAGKELLGSQLAPTDFSFDFDELQTIRRDIGQSKPLFHHIRTLRHPLVNLHPDIFLLRSKEDGLRFVRENLEALLWEVKNLHHRYITCTDEYAIKLADHFDQYYIQLSSRARHLRDSIADHSRQYGEGFLEGGRSSLKLKSLFSDKAKKVLEAKESIAVGYDHLREVFAQKPYFDFTFSSAEGGQIDRISRELDRFEQVLLEWRGQINAVVQEEVQRLNRKNVHPALPFSDRVELLEAELAKLLERLNDTALYRQTVEDKMLTLPKRQKLLEGLIEQLESSRLNLRDFDRFYDWQKNWLQLGPLSQKVLAALIKVKPDHWEAAFNSWYYHNLLQREQSDHAPTAKLGLAQFTADYRQLRSLLPAKVQHYWYQSQQEALKSFRKDHRRAYQQLFGKDPAAVKALPLENVLSDHLPLITRTIPILCMSAPLAAATLPREETSFDYVVLLEADRIGTGEAAALASLGKQVILVSDNRPEDPQSLLYQLSRLDIPVWDLAPSESDPQPAHMATLLGPEHPDQLHLEVISGMYDEPLDTNEAEAQRVIQLLNQIRKTPQRTFPSVGILAFTLRQRNLIASYLLKIKQQNAPGNDMIRQLERNGLSVLLVDELYGRQFDVLIISLTFGPINAQGTITEEIRFLEEPPAAKALRSLLEHPSRQILLVTSLQEDLLRANEGFFRSSEPLLQLYRFLQYAEAIQGGETARSKAAWEALHPPIQIEARDSVFCRELKEAMLPYFPSSHFSEKALAAGVFLPLVFSPKEQEDQPVALLPDAFLAFTAATSFEWEQQKREELETAGYRLFPVWSVQWWKDPREEARRLASQLLKQEAG